MIISWNRKDFGPRMSQLQNLRYAFFKFKVMYNNAGLIVKIMIIGVFSIQHEMTQLWTKSTERLG